MEQHTQETIIEEFRCWIESHPERAEAAAKGIAALEPAMVAILPNSEIQAITDLANMLNAVLSEE